MSMMAIANGAGDINDSERPWKIAKEKKKQKKQQKKAAKESDGTNQANGSSEGAVCLDVAEQAQRR